MCFFKKSRLSKKLFKMARSKFLFADIKGIPEDIDRSSVNFKEAKDNYSNISGCKYCLYINKDNLKFWFYFLYITKTKTAYMSVHFDNVCLNKYTETMEKLKSNYDMFNFKFDRYVKVVFPNRVFETEEEGRVYIDDFIKTWNESDIYKLFVELKEIVK